MKLKKALLVGMLGGLSVTGAGLVIGDEGGWRWGGMAGARQDVAPVDNEQYRNECGSCHFAYQPGLLPAATWQEIMQGLDDHFGENAELGAAEQKAISDYLTANAADGDGYSRFAGIGRSMQGSESLRITDSAYFRRKHDEVPARLVAGNPGVGSFARCDSCHTTAAQGIYDEHQVRIPGAGRWDDD
jgi:hypothetical protein